eukprot:3130654-Pyramimonas_sp.AAC.1
MLKSLSQLLHAKWRDIIRAFVAVCRCPVIPVSAAVRGKDLLKRGLKHITVYRATFAVLRRKHVHPRQVFDTFKLGQHRNSTRITLFPHVFTMLLKSELWQSG